MIAGTTYSRRAAGSAPRHLRRLPVPQTTDWADVQVVGIPRALLFYRFGVLWTTFFESIGRTVVVSDPTDKAIADEGDRLSVDECCLASKVFVGHVESLVGRCDAVFVPCYPTSDHRSGFCTKFQAAARPGARTPSATDRRARWLHAQADAVEGGARAPRRLRYGRRAWAARPRTPAPPSRPPGTPSAPRRGAGLARPGAHAATALVGGRAGAAAGRRRRPAHGAVARPLGHPRWWPTPTLAHDPYLAGSGHRMRSSDLGATVLYADEADHERALKASFDFSDTMPWVVNRELVGAITAAARAHRRHRAGERIPLRPRLHDRRRHHALHPGHAHSEPNDRCAVRHGRRWRPAWRASSTSCASSRREATSMAKPQALIEQVRSSVAVELRAAPCSRRFWPTARPSRPPSTRPKHHQVTPSAAFFRYCYYDHGVQILRASRCSTWTTCPCPRPPSAASEVGVQQLERLRVHALQAHPGRFRRGARFGRRHPHPVRRPVPARLLRRAAGVDSDGIWATSSSC